MKMTGQITFFMFSMLLKPSQKNEDKIDTLSLRIFFNDEKGEIKTKELIRLYPAK